jgi:hypothetical protein
MVHGIDHLLHHDVLEILEVVDHAGNGVDLSGEGDFEYVVVAVAVGVGGGTVEALILFLGQERVAADVGGGKFNAARD